MTAVVRALSEWAGGGSALEALVKVFGTVCLGILGLVYRRYLGILGANRRVPAERQAYDAIRESLAAGNLAARLYAERLTGFLDWIDRFFGDADMADRTLFPHAFGLRTPAPLWTAPAFDRCLLLALIYPIVTIFAIWAVSGHVGPAEATLRLPPGLSGWRRGLTLFGLVFIVWAYSRGIRTQGWRSFAWMGLGIAFGSVLSFCRIDAGDIGLAIGVVGISFFIANAAALFGIARIAATVRAGVKAGAVAVATAVGGAVSAALDNALPVLVAMILFNWMKNKTSSYRRQGIIFSIFVAMMITACMLVPG